MMNNESMQNDECRMQNVTQMPRDLGSSFLIHHSAFIMSFPAPCKRFYREKPHRRVRQPPHSGWNNV